MADAGSAAPSVAHPHPDEGHHHPHPHHRSCLSVAARVALRSFLVVLGVRAALSAVSIVARRRALRALIGADDLRMCAFAALFSGGVKAVNCFLVRVCELGPRRASLVSGAGAGLSIALLPPRERRTVVLYALVRAAEFAGRTALLTGRVPAPLARFQHWDVLIMCLSAMQILFSYVACPHTLDGSYLHFLRQHGAKDPRALKAIEQWFRRQPWNAADVAAVCQHAAIAVPQYEHFSPCMFTHPGTGCAAHFVRYLPPVFQRSLRLYLPVHLLYVAYLLYARRAHLNARSVQQLGWLFVNNLLRSCLFLSFYCATAWLMLCTTVSGLRMRSIPVGRLTQFFPGLALLFEFSSRRLELALYCAPRAIESAWNELKWHGYARPVPHADVALFAVAAAAVVYCHHHRRDALRGSVKTALTWLWHE